MFGRDRFKPVSPDSDEARQILARLKTSPPPFQKDWQVGERLRVTEGPFQGFTGSVDQVDKIRCVVHASLDIYGRPTPAEIDFLDIEPL